MALRMSPARALMARVPVTMVEARCERRLKNRESRSALRASTEWLSGHDEAGAVPALRGELADGLDDVRLTDAGRADGDAVGLVVAGVEPGDFSVSSSDVAAGGR